MWSHDPSTEETEGVLSIIPGQPRTITKACHTHAQAPQRNKQTQKERKKKRKMNVQRCSTEIQKFHSGSERYRGDNNWYRAGGKGGTRDKESETILPVFSPLKDACAHACENT